MSKRIDSKIVEKKHIEAVVQGLNKKFYKNFDTNYFVQKVDYLLVLLSDLDYLVKKIESGVQYGKLKTGSVKLLERERKRLRKNLESEIALTYYHAIETLFRLLIAHSANVDSPWIKIATTTSFKKFKEEVKRQISDRKLSFLGEDYDKSLVLLFFGSDLSKEMGVEKWQKNLANLKDLLTHFVRNILETPHYNSYKHGLTIFQEQIGFKLNKMLHMDMQDALTFLEFKKYESQEGNYLSETHHFLKWDEKYVLVYAVTTLIENMIGVASMRYCGKRDVSIKSFDQYDLNKILIKNEYGVVTDSISISL